MNKIRSPHSPSSGGIINSGKACAWDIKQESSAVADGYLFFYKKNIKLGFLPWFPTHKLYLLLWTARGERRISVWFFWVGNIFLTDSTTKSASPLEHSSDKEKFYTSYENWFSSIPSWDLDWCVHFLLRSLHPLQYFDFRPKLLISFCYFIFTY